MKKSALTPIKIKFEFLVQPDFSILVSYSGTDSRTHSVGEAVVNAIAAVYDFEPTFISRRG
jgi:hypothetical protein